MLMSKKEMAGYAIAVLFGLTIVVTQCVATNPETGEREFVTIEEMDQASFDQFEILVGSATRLSMRPLIEARPEYSDELQLAVEKTRLLLSRNDGTLALSLVIESLTEDLKNQDLRDVILATLAMLEMQGGIPYIEAGGTRLISERGSQLVGTILQALESVIPQ